MRAILSSAAAAAAVLAALTAHASGDSPRAELQPLAFLAGYCWQGAFPGGKVTDEHCFTWVYGGKFLRDRHTVHRGEGHPDDLGETIYLWDSAAHQLQYFYIESDGGSLRGTVTPEGGVLKFPESVYVDEGGGQQGVRSQWHVLSDHAAYDVLTEFRRGDEWATGFSVRMSRVRAAPQG